jgi:hypothetical protein
MQKYNEAPWWWYLMLLFLSFFAGRFKYLIGDQELKIFVGLIVVLKGQTTLPWWSYIIALVLGAFITVRSLSPMARIRLLNSPSAFFYIAIRQNGERHCHKSVNENGCGSCESRETCGKFIRK